MATYSVPGVYVNETLQATNAAGGFSADAIATFVGVNSAGGPVVPTLITSWSQFTQLFGSIAGRQDDLPFAVYSFFANGGTQCYVSRAILTGATSAAVTLDDAESTPAPALTLTATAPGTWAASGSSAITATVTAAQAGYFNLYLTVGPAATPLATESYLQVTMTSTDPRYLLNLINSPTIGSQYVTASVPEGATDNPAPVASAAFTGGADGTGTPQYSDAWENLDTIDSVLVVNIPGVSDPTTLTSLIDWAATDTNRFVVVDAPAPSSYSESATTVVSDATTLVSGLPASSYGAVYTPWIWSQDPSNSTSGAVRLTAPGGAVLANYAQNDVLQGVWKTPAGTTTSVGGIGAFTKFTQAQLGTLNNANVNVIRTLPGTGLTIMGGRTLDVGFVDKYINVRRTLMYIETSVSNLLQWAVFSNDDPTTWTKVAGQVTSWLTSLWSDGGLAGSTAAQAFFVTCDATNNTPSSIAAGILNVTIGVALETPAEFIVINIGQYDGGSTVTES